jgi:sialate O-acetylesterase
MTVLMAILVSLSGCLLYAVVKPNPLFTDGAVLQQGKNVPIWGTASTGEKITVTFQKQSVSTIAQDGMWIVSLKPLRAGGPFTMWISGENTMEIKEVMVGEVWVCSGQSNMWARLGSAANGKDSVRDSADSLLRLYTMPQGAAFQRKGVFERGGVRPNDLDVEATWRQSGPGTVSKFSAVGYYFGRDLRKALKVPVGIIHAAIGSSNVEEWIRRSIIESSPELKSALQPSGNNETGGLYSDMIAPILPYAIKGVIWYQGENNATKGCVWDSDGRSVVNFRPQDRGADKNPVPLGAYQYRISFPLMIRNWRDDWKQGNFPFLFVQVAPFFQHDPKATSRPEISTQPQEGTWAELRESQLLTALQVPQSAMVVITDFGDPTDIHPKQKEPVGRRLALAARAVAYSERIEYSGPIYDSMKVKGDQTILRFKHTGTGLVASGGDLKGFTIAGDDRKFVNAQARISGNKVVVWSPSVKNPVAVRYGWANYPIVNLFNKEGLPASPFRTDDFPLLTGPR